MVNPDEITQKTEVLVRRCWDHLVLALLGLSIALLSLHGFFVHIIIGWHFQAFFLVLTFVFGLFAPIPWYRSVKDLKTHARFLKSIAGTRSTSSNDLRGVEINRQTGRL